MYHANRMLLDHANRRAAERRETIRLQHRAPRRRDPLWRRLARLLVEAAARPERRAGARPDTA